MSIKKSHTIIAGTALAVGLLGLGGAAIAAPFNGDATASPSPSATPSASATPSMSTEELKKLYDPIIAAEENVLKEVTAAEAKATGAEKERLGHMKERLTAKIAFLKDRAAGKAPSGDHKGRGHRGGHGHKGDKNGAGKQSPAPQNKDEGNH